MRLHNSVCCSLFVTVLLAACSDDPTGGGGADRDTAQSSDTGGDVVADAATDASADTPIDTGTTDQGIEDTPISDTTTGDIGDDLAETCVPHASGEEICDNGFDDDCDGRVDEACGCAPSGAEQDCYPGDPAHLIAVNTGCTTGTQTCEVEFWGACSGAAGPVDEVCGDNIDNDCDDSIDEGCEVAGPEVTCPEDFEGPVLRSYTLQGEYSDPNGSPLASAFWTQLSWPPGHSHDLEPNGLELTFFADVAGPYEFQLTVENADQVSASCTTTFTATTADVLRIEMFWNPDYDGDPPDASDVDLYLHRAPTGDYVYFTDDDNAGSCFWDNCATCDEPYTNDAAREIDCRDFLAQAPPPDHPVGEPWPSPILSWSPGGVETDPRLDLDDVEGMGPENINILRPNAGTYRVAVHYWDSDGFGPSEVFVRVLCQGEEIFRSEGVRMDVHGATGNRLANDFWEVGDVAVDYDGTPACTFSEFGGTGCHRLCSLSEANSGGCDPAGCE